MQSHPYFNLRCHTDEELAELAGGQIIERVTLHEWPLSCVQRVTLPDRRKWIYKTAWGPTVEAEFYARARSPLLVPARTVYQQDGYVCLLIEWIDAPLLDELGKSGAELLDAGKAILAETQKLPGDLPCYLDLRSAEGWLAVVAQIIHPLETMQQAGMLQVVTLSSIQAIEDFCWQPGILDALGDQPGLVHGDLSADNIFVVPGSYRVIDWQRPIYGPQVLDLVPLAESCGVDVSQIVGSEVYRLHLLLDVHWFTQCAWRWFPEGVQGYDRQIADLVAMLREV